MSRCTIQMGQQGDLTATGRFTLQQEEMYRNQDLRSLLKELVKSVGALKGHYHKVMQNDGKMLGPERLDMADLMDLVLNDTIIVRALFEGDRAFNAIFLRYNHRLQIEMKFDRWDANGNLGPNRKINTTKFTHWISESFEQRVVSFIQTYSKASEDGHIDEAETATLKRLLDQILFGLLIAREEIVSGQIH